jgi:hypothetical protein
MIHLALLASLLNEIQFNNLQNNLFQRRRGSHRVHKNESIVEEDNKRRGEVVSKVKSRAEW